MEAEDFKKMGHSDDSTTYERQRKPEDRNSIFKKSKKTHRSPNRVNTDNKEMLVRMKEIVKKLSHDIKEIKE